MVDSPKNNAGSSGPASRNSAKRNSSGDKSKLSGNRPDSCRNRYENNKTAKGKNNKRNLACSGGNANGTNAGAGASAGAATGGGTSTSARATRQENEHETPKTATIDDVPKPKMVDSATQTSTPLRLQLDGMFGDAAAGGYRPPCLLSVESASTEYEEDDMASEMGGSALTPLSSRRSSSPHDSLATKDIDHYFKYEWTQDPRRQQFLIVPTEVPRCFQDLEGSHEKKILRITKQLNDLIGPKEAE